MVPLSSLAIENVGMLPSKLCRIDVAPFKLVKVGLLQIVLNVFEAVARRLSRDCVGHL